MANSYNIQVLRDGPRNFVVRVTGEIDMTVAPPADIAPTVLVDVANLNPPCSAVRVDRVKYSLPNGTPLDVQLWWQATTNELFFGAGGGDDGDYWNFGGLTNNAAPGATGNILFSTSGITGQEAVNGTSVYGPETLTFAMIVECVKLQPDRNL